MLFNNENFKKKIALILLTLYLAFDFSTLTVKVQAKEMPQEVNNKSNVTAVNNSDFVEGNALEISVFPDTSSFLNNIYPIDGNGYAFLPVLGKVKVTSMNKDNFRNFLIENYTEYLNFPNIQIRPLIRASILGGVTTPGLYYVDPTETLWHLLRLSGGTISEDGLKKMKWRRNKRTVSENLIPLLQSGQSLEQIGFRSGDQIWVPTPLKPGFLDAVSKFTPFITIGITVYTFYYFSRTGRRYY